MRYSSGIRSLMLGIFLLQIAAAVATISQPRVQRLQDILAADYEELFDVKSLDITELNKGSAEASFEELFKLMERQYFRGPVNTTQLESCYWKIYMMHNDLGITEEIRSRINNEWQILEDATRLYANFTGISRAPELKRRREDEWAMIYYILSNLDRQSTALAQSRVDDMRRIFGLKGFPIAWNNTGGDERLYEKGFKMIPDILQAFKEFYVDQCPNPITQEEAKIWTEHRAFVLDAYLAWARGYPAGNNFPRSEVDAFFQQFRDLYETMSNQELFDVKSLNIPELDMGSAEASFAGLFKRMEKQFPSQYPADASDFTG
ncbi:unnamed protein product, partial [Mesorhabditis spiculigera]